jgi:hypothetical protein
MIKVKSTGRYPRRAAAGFTVAFLTAALFCSARFSSFGQLNDASPVMAQAAATPPTCCGQDANKPHLLAASYYSVVDGLDATLMLNNKGPEPIQVEPTLYSLTGERFDAEPVVVPGESFRNFNLRDFGAIAGTLFEQGSLQLFHRGPDLVIGAQLYLVDEEHSLSFDEKLVEFQGTPTQLESVWWLPSRRSSVHLILSNTGDVEVTAQVIVNTGTSDSRTMNVFLSPHETRIINAQHEHANANTDVGSASIHHSGPRGALIARALISDKTSGYSLSAQFYSPQGGKSSAYQGVGLRLGTANGEDLTPVVVARNVVDVPTILTGRIPYTTRDGSTGVVSLPSVTLEPGEAKTLDVEHEIKKTVRRRDVATASLEFNYSSSPGSVMMSAMSVSDNRNQVFRVPMWDVPAQRNGTGGYPWFINGDSSTFVYIKNVTGTEQKYTFSLTYEGGDYSTGLRRVQPGETVAIDIRALRDNQVPDERNHMIPSEATRGKIVWSVRGRNPLGLLGRSEQVDLAKGISSSYACFMCCPNSFRSSRISPSTLEVASGTFSSIQGVERDLTCYNGYLPDYFNGDTWTIDNTNVATIDGSGDQADISAFNPGTATATAQWEVFTYTSEYADGLHYCVEQSEQTNPTAAIFSLPVRFVLASEPDGGGSSLFNAFNVATLNTSSCGGNRFKVKATFTLPSDSAQCCTNPTTTFVVLTTDNKFEFAPSLIDGTIYDFFGSDDPPYVNIYLRRKANGAGTTDGVRISVAGTYHSGANYSGQGTIHLVCQ